MQPTEPQPTLAWASMGQSGMGEHVEQPQNDVVDLIPAPHAPPTVVETPTKTSVQLPMIPVTDLSTVAQISAMKEGHDGPMQPVETVDVETGNEVPPFVERAISVHTLSQHIKIPRVASLDDGQGYEDWLKLPRPTWGEYPGVIALHKVQQSAVVVLLVVPSIILCYLFSLLVEEAVRQWNAGFVSPLQKNPVIAGLIGEPFHKLDASLLYGTFLVLIVLCPTKMLIHLLFMYGRSVIPVWKTAMAMGVAMGVGNFLAAVVMQTSGVHVPRIAWMGMIFIALFAGLFLCARQAAAIIHFPGFTFLFFRASFVANVLLYLYAVFFPFWFFGTHNLYAKLFLAIVFHPCVEYVVGFLWQHTAVCMRHNDPATSICPGYHYGLLFALYGSFLLVNFDEPWQNILGFSLLRLWTIACKIGAQELTYFTYVFVLRKTPEEAADILSTVRFKRYRNDVINASLLLENISILVAGAVTFLFNFNKNGEGEEPATSSLLETVEVVGLQILIGIACDGIADTGLAYRGMPWYNAWKTKQDYSIPKFLWITLVAVGMFLFYFYPFLASHMVLDGETTH